MTIAACYLSPEGVVLGADSTTTIGVDGPDGFRQHHYEYGQKIFEIGAAATLGITMWGLGSLGPVSYRTLIADLADDLAATPPPDVEDVARRWMARFGAVVFPPRQDRNALENRVVRVRHCVTLRS